MLDPVILMRRALRWVMDSNSIPHQAWPTLTSDVQNQLQDLKQLTISQVSILTGGRDTDSTSPSL